MANGTPRPPTGGAKGLDVPFRSTAPRYVPPRFFAIRDLLSRWGKNLIKVSPYVEEIVSPALAHSPTLSDDPLWNPERRTMATPFTDLDKERLRRTLKSLARSHPEDADKIMSRLEKNKELAQEENLSPYDLLPFQEFSDEPWRPTRGQDDPTYTSHPQLERMNVFIDAIEERYGGTPLMAPRREMSTWDKTRAVLSAPEDAAVTALAQILPKDQMIPTRGEAPESSWTELGGGFGMALPVIGLGAATGSKFGSMLGTKGKILGSILGGSIGAAAAGFKMAEKYLGLNDITEEQYEQMQDAYLNVFLNPIESFSDPNRMSPAQVLPDNPYLREFLTFTSLDPISDLVGIGAVGPAMSGVLRKLTGKPFFKPPAPPTRTAPYIDGARWTNEAGEIVLDPSRAVMSRAPIGEAGEEAGPWGWKYSKWDSETGQWKFDHYVDKEGFIDYVAEQSAKMGRKGDVKDPKMREYWGKLYDEGGYSDRTVGDVLRMAEVNKEYPSILSKEADELVPPSVQEEAVARMAEESWERDMREVSVDLDRMIREADGLTYDIDTRAQPTAGYSVAPFKDTESVLSSDDMTPEAIYNHLEKWKDFYKHEGMHFGAWHNKEEGKYVLDASIVVDDELYAAAIGKSGNQDAIWDFARKQADKDESYWGTEYPELEEKYGERLAEAVSAWEQSPLKAALQQTKSGIVGGVQGKGRRLLTKKGVPKTGDLGPLDNEFAVKNLRGKTDNIHIFTENLEGKDGLIMKKIIRPALYGGREGTRVGKAGAEEGQMAYDKAVYEKMKDLTSLLRKAKIGNFYEPKNPLSRGALKAARVFVRGGRNSRERSWKVINAIETGDLSTLNKDEAKLADWLTTNLGQYIKDINRVRSKMDWQVPVVLPRENYFPHVFTLSFFDGLYGDLYNMSDSSMSALNKFLADKTGKISLPHIPEFNPQAFKIHQREVQPYNTYPSMLPWHGNLEPREYNVEGWSRNIMTAMERYIEGAERIKKMSIPAVRSQLFFDKLAKEGKITSEVKQVYDDWIQEGLLGRMSGLDQSAMNFKVGPVGFKELNRLTSRMAGNLISGSMTFFLNNLSAIPALSSQGIGLGSVTTGLAKSMFKDYRPIMGQLFDDLPDTVVLGTVKNTMKALGFTANNFGIGHAMQKSKVLQNRVHTGYEQLGRQALKSGSVSKLAVGIMNAGDQFAVATAFNAAYNAGIKSGLAEEAAVQFADDIAMKTQAVYGRAFMSKLSRSKIFQTAAPFQTWIMQQTSWFRDNVLGKGTARLEFDKLTPAQRLGTAMKFSGMAFAVNSIYQSIGLPAPWDLGAVIPAWDQLKIWGGEKPSRDANLLAVKPLWDMYAAVGAISEDGFDMNNPLIRRGVEAGFYVVPNQAGLQMQRGVMGLFDLARGYTPTSGGKPIYLEQSQDWGENFVEGLQAIGLGPRRSRTYQKYKPPWQKTGFDKLSDTLFPTVGVPLPYVGPDEFTADFGFLNDIAGRE